MTTNRIKINVNVNGNPAQPIPNRNEQLSGGATQSEAIKPMAQNVLGLHKEVAQATVRLAAKATKRIVFEEVPKLALRIASIALALI